MAANSLSGLGRHDEADAIIARGVLKLPSDFNLNVHHAQQAMRRRAWPEALQRWEVVQSRFDHITGPLGAAQCLRELSRFAEADVVLADARVRFGMDDRLLAELADLATAKGDLDEAVQCWEVVIRRFPFFAAGYTKGAEAMRRIGRDAEADELISTAVTQFRSNLTIHLEYARSAHSRGDWVEARERWALIRGRFPECVEACEKEVEAASAAERQGNRPDSNDCNKR
jgi:tetratricopeptide (TPR) repeat protein